VTKTSPFPPGEVFARQRADGTQTSHGAQRDALSSTAFPAGLCTIGDVFDGALSPWHLAIIAVALFLVVGPRRFANRFNHVGRTVQRLVDDDGRNVKANAPTGPPTPARRSLAYRLGRLRRRGARASNPPKS